MGPVTTLEFVLTIGDPKRFPKSRDVGLYLGLTPAVISREIQINNSESAKPEINTYGLCWFSVRNTLWLDLAQIVISNGGG